MTKYLYYPGCSMDATGKAYDESLGQIVGPLGIELEEIEDWNCCGATEYFSVSLTSAYALIGRNLALAAQQANGSKTLVAPCSACYLNLAKTDHYMGESGELNATVNDALGAGGLSYKPGSVEVRHLLDVIVHDIGYDAVKASVVKPLAGLKVAPYLGCMVPRPDYEGRFSDHEQPHELDRLIRALGAEVVDFPLRTACCGGHMAQISPDMGFEMIRRLVHTATAAGADLMVTVCPMCQMNVDFYQGEMNRHFHTDYRMPILFFTQLMGVAFGKDPKALGFSKELISARNAMEKVGVEVPAVEEEAGAGRPRPRREKKQGLPMPAMPGRDEVEP
jgi:heterodisulfide reductase subunit B